MITDAEVEAIGVMLEERGLSHSEIDVYLEHVGVKGMKWGQRKEAFKRNRQLNKASRQKDAAQWQKEVEKARGDLASGKLDRMVRDAKAQYKIDKVNMGSREARKILNKAKQKRMDAIDKSSQYKNGSEAATAIAIAVGVTALSTIVTATSKA